MSTVQSAISELRDARNSAIQSLQIGRWSSAEKVQLLSMREAGQRTSAIAARMQRSVQAVRDQIRAIRRRVKGDDVERAGTAWTARDEELLRSMHESGSSYPEIADHLGRTQESVWSKSKKMGLRRVRALPAWPDATKAQLVAMRDSGARNVDIAARLGKSLQSVEHQIRRMGIQKPMPPCAGSDKALEAVLIKLHATHTNAEVAAFVGRKVRWVEKQYARLGMTRDSATRAQRSAANLGHDLPPEIRELINLRRKLVRKINEKSHH